MGEVDNGNSEPRQYRWLLLTGIEELYDERAPSAHNDVDWEAGREAARTREGDDVELGLQWRGALVGENGPKVSRTGLYGDGHS